MSKSKAKSERARAGARKEGAQAPKRPSTGVWASGLVLLLVAASGSLLLSLHEVAANFDLPGCGPASGCADIKNAEVFGVKVGVVPGLGWPVAYVGFAFFAAMLAAWWLSRRGVIGGVRAMALAGGAASVFYLLAMLIAQKFCVYCFTVHVANLAFVGVVVASLFGAAAGAAAAAKPASRSAPLLAGAGAFIVSIAALGGLDAVAGEKAEAQRAEQRAESREEIIRRSREGARPEDAGAATAANGGASTATSTDGAGGAGGAPATATREPFAGRWDLGPEQAPIRIVVFSDYQCHLCRATEQMLVPLVEQSDDIWLSVKHYPACMDCNPFVSRTVHPNACWAARAAETAGALGGEEAFWKMHKWLFARQGRFETEAELRQGVAAAGFGDFAAFSAYMMDESRSLPNVRADVEEAWSLGITQTPMVFINGVELRGMSDVSQLRSEIEALRAADLPAKTAAADRPPTAREKYVEMWEAEADRSGEAMLAVSEDDWSMGAEAPAVEIVMWGDYKAQGVPPIDAAVRELVAEYDWTRYTFRFYPLDPSCNEHLPQNPLVLEGACRFAQLAEAAGRIGGEEDFWKMHVWLMENADRTLGDFMAKFAAGKVGLDGEAVLAAANTPEVAAAIGEDARRKFALNPMPMPLLYVNGKAVPYRADGAKEIIREILLRAGQRTQEP